MGQHRAPPPTLPADCVLELTRLRSFVQELQRERDDLRAQVAAQTVVTEDAQERRTDQFQHRRRIWCCLLQVSWL